MNDYQEIQASGFKKRYDTDFDFALNMRFLSALASVPPDDVSQTFEYLTETINHFPAEVNTFVDYFEYT